MLKRFFSDIKILILANLWIIPVFIGIIYVFFSFVSPPPSMNATLITNDRNDSSYYDFALKLQQKLLQDGFYLNIIESSSNNESLVQLLNNEAEIALIQSGTETYIEQDDEHDLSTLETLGVAFQEPIFLFYKNVAKLSEFAMSRNLSIETLSDFENLKLAIGKTHSSANLINALLSLNGYEIDNYPKNWIEVGGNEAVAMLQNNEIDAAFFIGNFQDETIKKLANMNDLNVFNFKQTDAYIAYLDYLQKVDIPEGLLNIKKNLPNENIKTLAITANLVINDNFNPGLIALFLQAVKDIAKENNLNNSYNEFPREVNGIIATSNDAIRYYQNGLPILQKFLPFRIASLLDRYIILAIPLVMILIPLSKAIGPIYRWQIRARIYRWYKYLRDIDGILATDKNANLLHYLNELKNIEIELGKINVPLAYTAELYDLHVHLRLIMQKITDLIRENDINE